VLPYSRTMILDPSIETQPGMLTPFLRLDELLIEHAQSLERASTKNFVGMYLIGSLAVGDFDATSDVDFMVVTNDELSNQELAAVQVAHSGYLARDDRWPTHLEYSFFPLAKLQTLSSPFDKSHRSPLEERILWYFNGPSPERSDHDNTLVTRWTLRERGVRVLGPEPASFAPVVTPDELRQEIRNSIRGWDRERVLTRGWDREEGELSSSPHYNRFHQAFFVLNYCRALQGLHEGRISSKREGVEWAKVHLDPTWHPLIDFCWRERCDINIHVSQQADPDVFREVIAFSAYATRLSEAHNL
jgi:predicted nucleotidyltransferase